MKEIDDSLLKRYIEVHDIIVEHEDDIDVLKEEKNLLEQDLIELFSQAGISNIKIEGRTITLSTQYWAKMRENEDGRSTSREGVVKALRSLGLDDFIILETFSSQKVSSYIRELVEKDQEIPEELAESMVIAPKHTIKVRPKRIVNQRYEE